MPSRRRVLQAGASLTALAALLPWLPASAFAAGTLLSRAIPSSGEQLPVIGLGTSRTHDVALTNEALQPLREVLQALVNGGASLVDTAPSYGRAEAVCGCLLYTSAQQLHQQCRTGGIQRGQAAEIDAWLTPQAFAQGQHLGFESAVMGQRPVATDVQAAGGVRAAGRLRGQVGNGHRHSLAPHGCRRPVATSSARPWRRASAAWPHQRSDDRRMG